MMPSPTQVPPGEVPPPPPGPGVVTPFAAPPRDRNMRGLWIGLGVGGLVMVLCCVGGILGGGFLFTGLEGIARSQLSGVVDGYLAALKAEDYATARDEYLCAAQQRTHSIGWFQDHYHGSQVTGYTVREDDIDLNRVVVPATVERVGQAARLMEFTLKQESTNRYVICGGVE